MTDREGYRNFRNRKEYSGEIVNGKGKYMYRAMQLNRSRKLLRKRVHSECEGNSRLVLRKNFSVYMFGKVIYTGKERKDSILGRDNKVGSIMYRQIYLRQLDQMLCSFTCQCLRQLRFLSFQGHFLWQFWISQMQYVRPQQRLFFLGMSFYICQCFSPTAAFYLNGFFLGSYGVSKCEITFFGIHGAFVCDMFVLIYVLIFLCCIFVHVKVFVHNGFFHLNEIFSGFHGFFYTRFVRPHLRLSSLVLCSYTCQCVRVLRFLLSQWHLLLRHLWLLRKRHVRLHLRQNLSWLCTYIRQSFCLLQFLLSQQYLSWQRRRFRMRVRPQLCLHFLGCVKLIPFMFAITYSMGYYFIGLKLHRLWRQALCDEHSYMLLLLTFFTSIILTRIYSFSFSLSFSLSLCLSCYSCLSVLFFVLLFTFSVIIMMLSIILIFGNYLLFFGYYSTPLTLNFTNICIIMVISYKYSLGNIFSSSVFFIPLSVLSFSFSLVSIRNFLSVWTFTLFSPSCLLLLLDVIYIWILCKCTQLSSYLLSRTHRLVRLLLQFSYCDLQYKMQYVVYRIIRYLSYHLRLYLLCFKIGLYLCCICDINYLYEFLRLDWYLYKYLLCNLSVCKNVHFKCKSIILLLRGVDWKSYQWHRAKKEVERICMRNVDLMWYYPIGSGEKRVDYSMKLNNSVRQNNSQIERRKKSKSSIAEKINKEREKRKKAYNTCRKVNNKSKRRKVMSKKNCNIRGSVIRSEKQRKVGNKGLIAWNSVRGKKGKRTLNRTVAEGIYVGIDLSRERSKTVKLSEKNEEIRIRYRINTIKCLFGKWIDFTIAE